MIFKRDIRYFRTFSVGVFDESHVHIEFFKIIKNDIYISNLINLVYSCYSLYYNGQLKSMFRSIALKKFFMNP